MRQLSVALICIVLVVVACEDLRRYRIRNIWVAALLALSLTLGRSPHLILLDGLLALCVLAAMFAAFAHGVVGGGDAKLLAVACFGVGVENAVTFAVLCAAASFLYGAAALLRLVPARIVGGGKKIPFAPSIAIGWIGVICVQF